MFTPSFYSLCLLGESRLFFWVPTRLHWNPVSSSLASICGRIPRTSRPGYHLRAGLVGDRVILNGRLRVRDRDISRRCWGSRSRGISRGCLEDQSRDVSRRSWGPWSHSYRRYLGGLGRDVSCRFLELYPGICHLARHWDRRTFSAGHRDGRSRYCNNRGTSHFRNWK